MLDRRGGGKPTDRCLPRLGSGSRWPSYQRDDGLLAVHLKIQAREPHAVTQCNGHAHSWQTCLSAVPCDLPHLSNRRELEALPCAPHDPMSPTTCERGIVTRRIFAELADILRPGDAEKYHRSKSHPSTTRMPSWPLHRPCVRKHRRLSWPKSRAWTTPLSSMQRSFDKHCDLLLGYHGAPKDDLRSAKGKAPVRRLDTKAPTITSQPALTLWEHGAPFLAKDKSYSSARKGSSPTKQTIFTPLTPREEVVMLIRSRKVCYGCAFSISCDPKGCPFVNDHSTPGYTTATSSASVGRLARLWRRRRSSTSKGKSRS